MFPNGAGIGSILISQITTPTTRQKIIREIRSDIILDKPSRNAKVPFSIHPEALMARDLDIGSKMEPVTSPGVRAGGLKNVSANRVFSMKGPKSAVAKGSLSPRNTAPIVNGD